MTGNLELFRALARLGGELVALHLLESPKLDHPITEWVGGRNPEAHYHKIVIALSETIRLMAEIDTVIEKHGGWPDAFAQRASAATPPSPVREEPLPYAAEEQSPYGARTDRSPANAPPKAPKPDLGLRTEDELPLA